MKYALNIIYKKCCKLNLFIIKIKLIKHKIIKEFQTKEKTLKKINDYKRKRERINSSENL